ncbi:MAG: HD domain-containing protein [Nanoarchaeota archaeon]
MYSLDVNIVKALEFANFYHKGQLRKVTQIPFISHPLNVAVILIEENADINLICAGILHDLLEDTSCTIEDLKNNFNDDIVNLVLFATDQSIISDNNFKTLNNSQCHTTINTSFKRKIEKIYKTKNASMREILLEFADKFSNLESIYQENKQFEDLFCNNFHCDKKEILLYYLEMYKIFKKKIPQTKKMWLYKFYVYELLK